MKKPSKPTDSKTATDGSRSGPMLDSKSHKNLFASAMKAFAKGDFQAAKQSFDEASNGPELSVNESARMYSRMCAQRLEHGRPPLHTADDHYNYAVTLMNQRRHNEAGTHLRKALTLGDKGYIRYALALVCGIEGDLREAASQLQRAIDLDPSTRTHARNDSEFQPLLQDAAIRELVQGRPVES
jgi:tetratricopeptide (TPR) repeat protein